MTRLTFTGLTGHRGREGTRVEDTDHGGASSSRWKLPEINVDTIELDVKAAKVKNVKVEDEPDFFADMTPDITRRTSAMDLYEAELNQTVTKPNMFAAMDDHENADDKGWGDEDDW